MVERMPLAPRLSSVQRLWLLELGLDRPMLAKLAPDSPEKLAGPARGVAPIAANSSKENNRATATAALAAMRHGSDQPRPASTNSVQGQSTHAAPSTGPAPFAKDIPSKAPTEAALIPAKSLAANHPAPDDVPADWAALEARIRACEICELHTGRHRAVAGSGAIEAVDWLVVGEAPGERDDQSGQPFQGKAGELLHAMLGAAGIDPLQAVFYTNLVKCRPRSNRLPTAAEIAACRPHLHNQIILLRPRGILALGRLAAHALLADGKSDGRSFEALRGRVHEFQLSEAITIPLVVTYHPASLLSRPRHKAASWQDLNLARTVA